MKKLAMIATGLLSLGYLGAFEIPTLGVDTEVKFSSEYAKRGRKEGCHVFVPKVEVNMPMFEKGKVYAGTSAALGLERGTRNDVAPYLGASYDITDMFSVDAGYVHHFYTSWNLDGFKRDSNEIYVGIMADVLLSPSVYFYYDFDAEEVAIEGRVAYSFDFAQFGVKGVSLDLGAKLGYDSADKPFGIHDKSERTGSKDYIYYGLNADLVYNFNEHAKARAGIAYEGNGATDKSWTNSLFGEHTNLVWFNASVDCSF